MGHIIQSFGIHIGELTNDERTLEAVMMDMMTRSMAASRVRSSLVSSPICIPKLCMMCPMLFVFMYIVFAISSANMRASWPLLQYNTSSRPVGKEAYPLMITPVFALAFAVSPNKNQSH